MFSEENAELVLRYARHRVLEELKVHGTGARIARATKIAPGMISRWNKGKKNPGEKSVRKLVEKWWRMSPSAFVAAAREWQGVSTVRHAAVEMGALRPTNGFDLPTALVEAIQIRAGRWSGETIQRLQDCAQKLGLQRTVGAWIDCGDELDMRACSVGAQAHTVPPESRPVKKRSRSR